MITNNNFNDICKKIYPLTIISDRYSGTYSGGNYTAWNCHPDCIPEGVYEDDVSCSKTWFNIRKHKYTDSYGVGDTIEEAVFDLYSKIYECENDE